MEKTMRFQVKLNGKLYEPQALMQLGSSGYVHIVADDEQKRRCILAVRIVDLGALALTANGEIASKEIDLTGVATLLTVDESVKVAKRIAR